MSLTLQETTQLVKVLLSLSTYLKITT